MMKKKDTKLKFGYTEITAVGRRETTGGGERNTCNTLNNKDKIKKGKTNI